MTRIAPTQPVSQKRKSQRKTHLESDHFGFVAQLPCIITGERDVEVAHIRSPDALFGKREPGNSAKSDFVYTVPLSKRMHDEQGRIGELKFWERYGHPMRGDPRHSPIHIALALAGYSLNGDPDGARAYIKSIRETAQ